MVSGRSAFLRTATGRSREVVRSRPNAGTANSVQIGGHRLRQAFLADKDRDVRRCVCWKCCSMFTEEAVEPSDEAWKVELL